MTSLLEPPLEALIIPNFSVKKEKVVRFNYQGTTKNIPIEREIRSEMTELADESAIKVFGVNVKNLLLQAPIKNMTVMGFDPAYRTGCKIAVIDKTGKLLNRNIDVVISSMEQPLGITVVPTAVHCSVVLTS